MGGSKGGSKVETRPTINPEQQALLSEVTNFLRERIGQGGTATPFDEILDQPQVFTDLFKQFEEAMSDPSRTKDLTAQLQTLASGEGVYQADVERISREQQELVLAPGVSTIMESMKDPLLNTLNQPGRFFASDVPEKVGRAVSTEVGRSLLPGFQQSIEMERQRGFASQEAFMQRQPSVIAALQGLPSQDFMASAQAISAFTGIQQDILNRRKQEFLRLNADEFDPFLNLALSSQVATAQTQQSLQVARGQSDIFGDMAGVLGIGLGMQEFQAGGGVGGMFAA